MGAGMSRYVEGRVEGPGRVGPERSVIRWRAGARLGGRLALALLAVGAGWLPLSAEAWEYVLEVPDRQAASFVLDFNVDHPGILEVQAEWSGSRSLSFRVQGPGSPAVKARRSGPSPQRLEIEVDEATAAADGPWRLFIRALPAGGRAEGSLTIAVPGPTERAAPHRPVEDLPPPKTALEAWARSRPAPPAAPAALVAFHNAVEDLRAWVVIDEDTVRRDACGWQTELLRYLADRRDRVTTAGAGLSESTARFVGRLAKAVRAVEGLRSSEDPMLVGPVPEDPRVRRTWLAMRQQTTDPVESELDALGRALRRGYAPELEGQTWPQRFLACLTACERYFEQLPRLGREKAANGELALDQWDGFLEASDALEALSAMGGRPGAFSWEPAPSPARSNPRN